MGDVDGIGRSRVLNGLFEDTEEALLSREDGGRSQGMVIGGVLMDEDRPIPLECFDL